MSKNNIEKKYRVFISSTQKDLVEERKKVIDALLKMGCIPAGMEMFNAHDTEQFKFIKKDIDMCDFYILVIDNRYGSIDDGTGKSFTEMEYDYAVLKGIPVLAFIRQEAFLSPTEEDITLQSKLKEFRAKAMNGRIVVMWDNSVDLERGVLASIPSAIEEHDRPGWIRGSYAPSTDCIFFRDKKRKLGGHN